MMGCVFRIAEPAVVFDDVGRAVRMHHDAGVQKTGKRCAVFREAADGGLDDLAHDAFVHGAVHDRRG